jgi:exodeoxyribonuclease-3
VKITTWNVNGLRAVLNKGAFEQIRALDSDVFCLQEIKARPEQVEPAQLEMIGSVFPHLVWNPAARPGYSGTATWTRIGMDECALGLGIEAFDVEGRVVASRFGNLWLFNIYFPNGQHDLGRVPYKLDFYARLLELCDELHSKGQFVVLAGDFNTAHNEIDLRHPKANSTQTGFLPEERAEVDRYLQHGFVDAYRRLYPTKVEYTWWSFIANARKNNTGWRLDYFLVSEGLFPRVIDVVNHTEIMGSDHCPVSLILSD